MNKDQLLRDRGVSRTSDEEGGKEDRGDRIGKEKKECRRLRDSSKI
jgi:hypothetical protein